MQKISDEMYTNVIVALAAREEAACFINNV